MATGKIMSHKRVISGPRYVGVSFGFLAQRACLVVCLGLPFLAGCTDTRDQFIGSRVLEVCNGQWPVCDTTVGCFVGDQSYVSGRFPGSNQVGIQIFEPSQVTATFYVSNVASSGVMTVVNLYEDRCRSRVREEITGRTFIGEMQTMASVARKADLTGTGDHLISWESDSRSDYLLKIDILPLRLRDTAAAP
jgi:hypothetical protein